MIGEMRLKFLSFILAIGILEKLGCYLSLLLKILKNFSLDQDLQRKARNNRQSADHE